MKKYTLYIYMVCTALLCLTGCADDFEPSPKGWLCLDVPAQDTLAETRVGGTTADYLVSIHKGLHSVMSPTHFNQVNGPIALTVGNDYSLTAESCTKTDAEHLPTLFGQPRYASTVPFSINANQQTRVSVTCTMDNAAFQLHKTPSFYYTSYVLKATVGSRTLTFTDEQQMGYFNVEADGTALLHYTIEATGANGQKGHGKGTVRLKRKTLSILNLKAPNEGHIDMNVTYDDSFTPVITDIILTP